MIGRWRFIALCFAVKFKGRPIELYTLPKSRVQTSYLYQLREAARWAHYRWHEFIELDSEDQAAIVAHYELHHTVQYLESVEQSRAMKRKR